eukprot:scaffold936_cov106-Amphora_coffeaeformis.AAC.11
MPYSHNCGKGNSSFRALHNKQKSTTRKNSCVGDMFNFYQLSKTRTLRSIVDGGYEVSNLQHNSAYSPLDASTLDGEHDGSYLHFVIFTSPDYDA